MAEKDRILPTPLSPGGCARVGRGHSWPSGREDKGWWRDQAKTAIEEAGKRARLGGMLGILVGRQRRLSANGAGEGSG